MKNCRHVFFGLIFMLVLTCLLGGAASFVNATDVGYTNLNVDSSHAIAYNPHNGYIYMGQSVISGTTVVGTYETSACPHKIAYNPINHYMYIVCQGAGSDGTVSVINGTTNIANIIVGRSPEDIVYNASNGYMYVANSMGDYGNGTVSVINGLANIATIKVSDSNMCCSDIAYNPMNGYIYINSGFDAISVISGTTVIAEIKVGQGYRKAIAYNAFNGYMYAVNSYINNTVSVINRITNIATIEVGEYPMGIAHNPSNGYMYVGNCSDDTVSVIDGTTNIATIELPAGSVIGIITYNPKNGYIYVSGRNNASVIDGLTYIAGTGTTVFHFACNTSNGYMYGRGDYYNTLLFYEILPYIASDLAFTSDESPYIIHSGITIDSTAKLTIEDGTQLQFEQNVGIVVNGELSITGSVLTSDHSTPSPGDWNGIEGKPSAKITVHDSTIEYAKTGIKGNDNEIEIRNSNIRHCCDDGIHIDHTDNFHISDSNIQYVKNGIIVKFI